MCEAALAHTVETCLNSPLLNKSSFSVNLPNKDGKHSSYAPQRGAPHACWDQTMRPSPSAASQRPVRPDLICTANVRMCAVMCVMWKQLKGVFIITYASLGASTHRHTAQHLQRFAAGMFESSHLNNFSLKTRLLPASSALVCSLFVLRTGH